MSCQASPADEAATLIQIRAPSCRQGQNWICDGSRPRGYAYWSGVPAEDADGLWKRWS